MIKLLKSLLFLAFSCPVVMQASSFRRLGSKVFQGGKAALKGGKSVLKGTFKAAAAVTGTFVGAQNFGESLADKENIFLAPSTALVIKALGFKYENLRYLHQDDPKLYALCKQIHSDLGLDEVDIKFYVSTDDLPYVMFVMPNHIVDANSCVMFFNKTALQEYDEEMISIMLRHEFAHIEQKAITGTAAIRPCNNQSKVYSACYMIIKDLMRCRSVSDLDNFVKKNKKKSQLFEQAADAAACGDCSCHKCLQEFALSRMELPSAMVNSEENLVSDSGYLSAEEIMQYADATKQDIGFDGLCEKHKNQYQKEQNRKNRFKKNG